MHILGLIPARGGSRGIPQKNVALVNGRPLLAYTCEAARSSRLLTRTIVSTEDPVIANLASSCGVEVPFIRPNELAQDDSLMLGVVRHALEALEENDDYRPHAVVLLQPTSPLRRAEHIDAAIDILLKSGADSVVSVVEVPHQFNLVSLMKLEQGRLLPFIDGHLITRRQDKPVLYARNGPAVLACRRDVILEKDSLYGDDCRPFFMSPEDSIDVDTQMDLVLAGLLLDWRRTQGMSPPREGPPPGSPAWPGRQS